ncbi:hypothetical protein GOP47_0026916 [Adiantum capillus-veneris]|nr:hypothetical protein GOP47_0026916 [Adiantum capillus-veneris]
MSSFVPRCLTLRIDLCYVGESSALDGDSHYPCCTLDHTLPHQAAAPLWGRDFQDLANDFAVEFLPTDAAVAVPAEESHEEDAIINTFLKSLMEPVHQTNGVNLAASLQGKT